MQFSQKIRSIRKQQHLTQEEFAAVLGTSRGNYSCLETGKVLPTPMLLNYVSLLYGVDRDWLADDSQDGPLPLNSSSNLPQDLPRTYELLREPFRQYAQQELDALLALQTKLDNE